MFLLYNCLLSLHEELLLENLMPWWKTLLVSVTYNQKYSENGKGRGVISALHATYYCLWVDGFMSISHRSAWCLHMPGIVTIRFTAVGLFVRRRSKMLFSLVASWTICSRPLFDAISRNFSCSNLLVVLPFIVPVSQSISGRLKSPPSIMFESDLLALFIESSRSSRYSGFVVGCL